jgi:hypothetical protein
MAYPKDRLQIQILDDSTDDTLDIVHRKVVELLQSGYDVVQLRRFYPTGYKAGALADGLLSAKGEFVAIFDADFVAPEDFLLRTIPHFTDREVGMVQGRWAHLNEEESWFTRLQGQILDGLMIVEQTAKVRKGLPIQFNGTAGVWRRETIDDAGGWRFDSLTEDLDLSLRAQLRGWKLLHLADLAVPSELPRTLGLFRVQQRRWALGTAQLLRKRLGTVLRSDLPVAGKLSFVVQLARHLVHPLLLAMVVTVPLTTFNIVTTPIEYGPFNAGLFAFATLGVAAQHALAAQAVGRSVLAAILRAPLVIALALGLAPTYTMALWYGLRDRAGPFHRTPKVTRKAGPGEPRYRAERSVLVLFELAIALTYCGFGVIAASHEWWMEAAFFAFVAFAFGWMGLGSLGVEAESPRAPTADARVGRASIVDP